MKRSDVEIERNDFLRRCVPGDELELECWDFKTRKVTVTGRIDKQNGGVTLKARGHGAEYQIDVSGPDYPGASVRIIWTSGNSQVRYARLKKESEQLWSSATTTSRSRAHRSSPQYPEVGTETRRTRCLGGCSDKK